MSQVHTRVNQLRDVVHIEVLMTCCTMIARLLNLTGYFACPGTGKIAMIRWTSALVVTCGVMLTALTSLPASAQDTQVPTAVITFPSDNAQLFGQVNIFGSAAHPSAFDSYTLEFNDLSDPNAPWMLVQPRVRQQVNDNVLGAWNTNVVPDGIYRLRLRVFLQDGQVGGEFTVTGLQVINTAPTPLPTSAGAADSVQPVPPTPGPSPTSPIQQPPGSAPATPDVITGLDNTLGMSETNVTAPSTSTTTTRINTARIRHAFCAGVYWALGLFVVMLIYVATRERLRPFTRRLLWQIQDDINDDL